MWQTGAVTRIADQIIDFLLPTTCAACGGLQQGSAGAVICGLCWARCHRLSHPRCDRCGHPHAASPCHWCSLLPDGVTGARSYCWVPEGSGGPIVHALKYRGWRAVGGEMARRISPLMCPAAETRLIPVPLAPARLRERGFNQSEIMARGLAAAWGVAVWPNVLERRIATRAQAQLTPDQRLMNVAGAFRVTASATFGSTEHLILVDDVVTTAATLNACAAALLEAGARSISYVTFGRARAPGDVLP